MKRLVQQVAWSHLEAAGEQLQSGVELSVVVETLQGCQTLQAHLALLRTHTHTH